MSSSALDFSYKDLSNITDLTTHSPRKRPEFSDLTGTTKEHKTSSDSVKLNNNKISTLTSLPDVLGHLTIQPLALTYLDLSFNRLTHVEPVLIQFQNLRVLYLHGNLITNFPHLEILNRFVYLRTLTLHGNPVDRAAGFRFIVISWLRQLKSLDFSVVTDFDRFNAEVWGRKWNVTRIRLQKERS